MRNEIGSPTGLPMTVQAAGNSVKGYSAFVMEHVDGQIVVKHIIAEGFKSVSAALQAALRYKAEHPNFPWMEDE